jgi:protein SCO1/2
MRKTINTKSAAWLLMAFLLAGVAACKQQAPEKKFNSIDITSADFGHDFRLTDHFGKVRTLSDFKNKIVIIFFGYTHCPEVCPSTMSDLSHALKSLGNDAGKVQVLFVTLDPERDTQALLAKYVPSFSPDFLGLYGDKAATEKVAKDFRIFFQKQKGKSSQQYDLDHTAGAYVFDQSGKIRLFLRYGQGAESIAQDLRKLLVP